MTQSEGVGLVAEGFASLDPSFDRSDQWQGPAAHADYRGPVETALTREWWLRPDGIEPEVAWLTAPAPAAEETTFVFAGESSNLPEGAYPPNQASLWIDDKRALSFDLGIRAPRIWRENDITLGFEPRQVHATVDGFHRQFQVSGCGGLYRLTVPGQWLTAGSPLALRVQLEPRRTDEIIWFALRQRTDVLEESERTNGEQIAQLQRELIRLKRTVGSLARRSYTELFPERIEAEHRIVYANGRAHLHVPDVELLANGDLLVCWAEGAEHISVPRQIVTVRSTDGGSSWGDRRVVREHPETDHRDVSLAQMSDGTLLMNEWVNSYYDQQGRYVARRTRGYRSPTSRAHGIYVGRSTDLGKTWSFPERPLDHAPFETAGTSERIVELPSGRLLMATYHWSEQDIDATGICSVFSSDDGGENWQYLNTLADAADGDANLYEPAMLRMPSGRLLALLRNDGPTWDYEWPHPFYLCFSDDDGTTWSEARPCEVPSGGSPCCAVALDDGTILCIHAARGDAASLYAVASYDGGETWDMPGRRVIRDDLPNVDCGYPSAVVLPDGSIFTVYYYNMFDRFVVGGSTFEWKKR